MIGTDTAAVGLPASYAGDYWGEVPAASNAATSHEMFEDLVRQLRTDKAFMDTVNGILAMNNIAGVPTGEDTGFDTGTRNSANNNRKNNSDNHNGRLIRDASVARLAAQQREIARKQEAFEAQQKSKTQQAATEKAAPEPEVQNVIEYEQRVAVIEDERAQNPLQPLKGVFAELASRLHGLEVASASESELATPMETPKVAVVYLVPKMVSRQQVRKAA